MITVQIEQGDTVAIELRDNDGRFEITWSETTLTVNADMPDLSGRGGQIYCETWSTDTHPVGIMTDGEIVTVADVEKNTVAALCQQHVDNADLTVWGFAVGPETFAVGDLISTRLTRAEFDLITKYRQANKET